MLNLATNYKKVVLEIGFGNGENTAFLADKNPDALIIASEVYKSGIGSLLASIAKNCFQHIKIFDDDIRELLLNLTEPIFHAIYIICPDPWPKARHHKRRLVDKVFLENLNRVMHPGGTIYVSTDWENYAESIEEAINNNGGFIKLEDSIYQEADLTKFQQRAVTEGRKIYPFPLKKVN